MKRIDTKFVVIIGAIVIAAVAGIFFRQKGKSVQISKKGAIHSPYAGQELRRIKSLSQEDIRGLLAGTGMPFGGMAKLAELNGYPGPRHVLDAYDAGELELTREQYKQIKVLYEKMRSEAIELGKRIIAIEKELNDAFAQKTITKALLQQKVEESAELYGQLRFVHLKYHLSMMKILTPQQIARYNQLRGYTAHRSHKDIPEGHDPEM